MCMRLDGCDTALAFILNHFLFQFTGDLSFEFNRTAVLNSVNQFYSGTNSLAGFTCRFDASVTEQGSNLTETGYSTTDLLDPRMKLAWVGDRVRTFKPDSTFTVYVRNLYDEFQLLLKMSHVKCYSKQNCRPTTYILLIYYKASK